MTTLRPASPRHRRALPALRIAIVAPPTCERESEALDLAERSVRAGHRVTLVSARRDASAAGPADLHLERVAGRRGAALWTALAAAHLAAGPRPDVVLLFGSAAAPAIPLLRARGAAVAVRADPPVEPVDPASRGLRRRRFMERLVAREADAVVAADGRTADFYADEFGVTPTIVRPGVPSALHVPADEVERVGLIPGAFHLLTASSSGRLEVALEGYHRSSAAMPLVVVGSAPRAGTAAVSLRDLRQRDPRIRVLGDVRAPRLLEQLAFHAASSIHGDAGGAHDPALLRAMGSGTTVVCWDSPANRETAGTAGSFFSRPAQLAVELEQIERYPLRFRDIGELMQERARTRHDPDAAAEALVSLAAKLARGYSTRGMSTGRRIAASTSPEPVVTALGR